MATNRQTDYLRDLGANPTVDLTDIAKETASRWIAELKGLAVRAGLRPGEPLSPARLATLDARPDALRRPPEDSLSPPDRGPTSTAPAESPQPAPPARADESWWKLELSTSVPSGAGTPFTVTVSGSEHHQGGLDLRAADLLAARVWDVLGAQLERAKRA